MKLFSSDKSVQMHKILKKYFGYDSFRKGQENVISSVLSRQDTLAVMPTGGGKSLCYQLPALIFEGLTVVVSPLIALMQDQVAALENSGIDALFLNSSLDWDTYRKNMASVRMGKIRILYCAPETLMTERLRELLTGIRIDCITVDEAHCISEWGHDFRPDYRNIASFRKLFPEAVCLALTATATEKVRKDIKKSLNMLKCAEFISSFDRENIFLEIVSKHTRKEGGAENQVIDFIRLHKNESGIIYCFSRKQVDSLTESLCIAGIDAKPYHAGLSDKKRAENQVSFIKDETQIIVATIAFGMGINKPNVRFVIHFDLPKSLEQYYQEIGRAGRDGEPSHALLLYSYGDIGKIRFFLEDKKGKEKDAAEMQLKAITDYAEAKRCRRKMLLSYFGEVVSECSGCDICAAGVRADVDMTVPVQKLLSCIIRTNERYGASYIIDILLGSREKRVLENHHDKLSTWGIGVEYAREDWFQLVQLLLEKKILAKTDDYHVLFLTGVAKDILRNKESVFLPFIPSGKIGEGAGSVIKKSITLAKRRASKLSDDDDSGQLILSELKRIRKKLAAEADVPPYVIFSDKTLEDIAAKKPSSKSALLSIHGIGEIKAMKFGEIILRTVQGS